MTSIFVAKLDFGITNEQLKSTFEQYGKVLKASVAMDRETGKSRGFGFVEMEDDVEAQNAINGLNESLLNGRPIAVKEADNRAKPAPSRGDKPDFNSNRERKPFNSSPSPYKKLDEKPIEIIPPVISLDSLPKSEPKKKEKKKKGGSMEAYKKSGKANRFLDDEDDDFNWRPSGRTSSQFEDDDEDEEVDW